jgi:hypothetical protein
MVCGSFDESKERRLLFGVYASAFEIWDRNDLEVLIGSPGHPYWDSLVEGERYGRLRVVRSAHAGCHGRTTLSLRVGGGGVGDEGFACVH